ncbi:MAG: 2-amino-4-hydroxy-6-hydroxymethyldihydropteridine diphosphokinase [Gammaproteobacteria bacterium]|nr:2-amino-4-hydroxy-6-hydroxymethyldihydropteridine diphosphokinase [Gammaproteobacteria bacterium]
MNPSPRVRAYIGLGSNLASPLRQVRVAISELAQLPQTALVAVSPLYRSTPLGPAGQPYYINAVAAIDTRLSPLALLDGLQAIERRHGRQRGAVRWGPRTLDLDLLLYGEAVIDEPRLTVPHAEMAQRGFVLRPLADIAPLLRLPNGETPQLLCEALPRSEMAGMWLVAAEEAGTCL